MFKGKSKEEDKIEKIIRGLLKLPENRRCINCNSLGPQYVCTTFWTFVCTNCSGIHREFTHRVKSVSMAKFTSEEVCALQAGGNERARKIYLKTWDPVRHGFPDNNNINRLREFLKHVYMDRRFSGEGPPDRLPRLRVSDRDDSYDHRCLEERSSFHERYTDRSTRSSFAEVGSPHYFRGAYSPGSYKRSASRSEVSDNQQRDGDPVLRRSATQMFTTADIGLGRSLVHPRNRGTSSPPAVGHVREILGEKFLALRVADSPRNGGRRADGPARAEVGQHSRSGDWSSSNGSSQAYKAAPSCTTTPDTPDRVKVPKEGSQSLVDDEISPPPNDSTSETQTQQNLVARDGNNSINSESYATQKTCVPKQNTLEFLLFEFSSPADAPPMDQLGASCNEYSQITEPPVNSLGSLPVDESHASSSASSTNMPTPPYNFCSRGASSIGMTPTMTSAFSQAQLTTLASKSPTSGFDVDNHMPVQNANDGVPEESPCALVAVPPISKFLAAPSSSVTPAGPPDMASSTARSSKMAPDLLGHDDYCVGPVADRQLPDIQQAHHTARPCSDIHPQQANIASGAVNDQLATTCYESNVHGSSSGHSQSLTAAYQDSETGVGPQPSAAEIKSNGRKELPVDFFTSLYSFNPAPVHGWQSGPHYGMSFNMQYHPALMQMPGFPTSGRSTNPFDMGDEIGGARPPTAMFPPMTSLHGALANIPAPGGISTSSFGSPNPGASIGQLPFGTIGQHRFGDMANARAQGVVGGYGVGGGVLGSLESNQHAGYQFPAGPPQPNTYPTGGGNPFG